MIAAATTDASGAADWVDSGPPQSCCPKRRRFGLNRFAPQESPDLLREISRRSVAFVAILFECLEYDDLDITSELAIVHAGLIRRTFTDHADG